MARDEDHEVPEGPWEGEAAKPHDAAVQRALVEAQQTILHFLQSRLRDRDEAEEVLQRFSLRALERARSFVTFAPCAAGWARFWRQRSSIINAM